MNNKPEQTERGQQIVLFGVLLGVIVTVGAALAINLAWLRADWTALQEAAISAAAAGTAEIQGLPGHRTLDPDRAEKAARTLLAANLATLPFLNAKPGDIAADAEIYVLNPDPGKCLPDPLGGPPCCAPAVSLRSEAPIHLPWGGWQITLPLRAVAKTGTSPQ